MEKQKREIGKKQKELEDLQNSLASINPKDPRHVSKTEISSFYVVRIFMYWELLVKAVLTDYCAYFVNYIFFCYLSISLAAVISKTYNSSQFLNNNLGKTLGQLIFSTISVQHVKY